MTVRESPFQDRFSALHPEALARVEDFKQRGVQWQPPIHAEGICPSCDAFRLMGGESWPVQELRSALHAANRALDALAATLELHAEEPWQVAAHRVACEAWRITEDALHGGKAE